MHEKEMSNCLHYSKLALQDLEGIWEYILTESCSLDIADNTVNNILNSVERLEDFCELGRLLNNIVPFDSDYRVLIVKEYLVFYRNIEKEIFIDRIIHSKRNYIRILFGES